MNKFFLAAVAGTLAGVVATTQVAGPLLAQENARNVSVYEQLDLFGDIFERIRSQYVEEVDDSDLIEAAINGMLTSLDPHSSYLSPKAAKDMRVQTRGEFGGLGIEVTQAEGFVKGVSPRDGPPACGAGSRAGATIRRKVMNEMASRRPTVDSAWWVRLAGRYRISSIVSRTPAAAGGRTKRPRVSGICR